MRRPVGVVSRRPVSSGGRLRRSHPQRRETGRTSGASSDQVRNGDQPQDSQGAWPSRAARSPRHRRRGGRMRRCKFNRLAGAAHLTIGVLERNHIAAGYRNPLVVRHLPCARQHLPRGRHFLKASKAIFWVACRRRRSLRSSLSAPPGCRAHPGSALLCRHPSCRDEQP